MVSERSLTVEAQVLDALQELLLLDPENPIRIKELTERFLEIHGADYKWKITAKWIGNVVHRKLHLRAERTRDGYAIPVSEWGKIQQLLERYGLCEMSAKGAAPVPNPRSMFTSSRDSKAEPG